MVIDARIHGDNAKAGELEKKIELKEKAPLSLGKPCLLIPARTERYRD